MKMLDMCGTKLQPTDTILLTAKRRHRALDTLKDYVVGYGVNNPEEEINCSPCPLVICLLNLCFNNMNIRLI